MELVSLKATPRDHGKGITNKLRRDDLLPVVLYGRETRSRSLVVPMKELKRVLAGGAGRNTLIKLEIEGEKLTGEAPTVIIKDLQFDPIRGRCIHADLMQISLKVKIKARVPLLLLGDEAVAREGGIVQHQMRDVEVECLPTDLPDHITVDLTGKGIGESIVLGDLVVAGEVRIIGDPAEVVASVVAPKMVAGAEAETADTTEGEGPREVGGRDEG